MQEVSNLCDDLSILLQMNTVVGILDDKQLSMRYLRGNQF